MMPTSLVPPEDQPSVRAAAEEVLRAGTADVVHRIVRPDGGIRHVRNSSEAIYAADGTPVVVLGTCQDVTDQVIFSTIEKRVKELTCLVAVGRVLQDLDDPSLVYACVAADLVLAMQYPDRAIAVIDIDGRQHSTAAADLPHAVSPLLSAPVVIRGQERGRIHVGYGDGDDEVLPQERDLLEAAASMVALWLERRESAAALAESDEGLRRLLDNVPDVVFRLRLGDDGGFDYVNPAVETLTGYRAEEFLADPQLMYRLLGSSHEAGQASQSAGAEGGGGGLVEIVARDGSQRWVEYNLVSIVGDRNDVIALDGVARDVTDRVVATRASQERAHEQAVLARISEAALIAPGLDALFETVARLVVETLPVQASFITELTADADELLLRAGVGWPDGHVGVARFAVADPLFGATLGSDTPTAFVDIRADGAVSAPFLAENGFISGVAVRIPSKDGTFGVLGACSAAAGVHSTHHIAFVQTVAHILGAAVDRWKAEAALTSREREFRTLAESLPDIVGRVDRDHRHLYVNPAVKSLGVAPQDVIGKTLREIGLPADLARVLERAADDVFARGHEASVEFVLHSSDGERRLQSLLIPEFDQDGTVATVVKVIRDITALRRVEELRREGLIRIVAAQEQERGRIGEDIHDDSIQVMTAVGMRLEGLRRQIDDPEARLLVGRLEDVVRHSVNRLRALMFELRPPELDREGLASALRLYFLATAGNGAPQCNVVDEWRADPPVDVRNVLYRIALEAIANARKHADASLVEVLVEAAEGGVRMRVRDDGSGFNLATLADMGPHHLGTISMRERAEAFGGTLDIHSAPGEGTVVTAWLPVFNEIRLSPP